MWYEDKRFWKAAFSRALRSIAQGAITGIGASAALYEVDWKYCVGSALLMGVVSICTSIALGVPEYEEDD